MLLIGLTGNIASGKSCVASVWRELGASIIDADAIGHEVIQKDSDAYSELIERFGDEILDESGEVNRSVLAKLVFGRSEELRALNDIVHPPLLQRMDEYLDIEWKRGAAIVVVDAALLFEFGLTDLFDMIVLVDADERTRMKRVAGKRRISEDEALRMIKAQMDPETKKELADYLIRNEGTLDDLSKKAVQLFEKIKEDQSID